MSAMTTGSSSRADANRRRILDVALAELLRDPDASMDQIARAAGVVRRTVYGHFPNRDALIGTLVDGAVEAVAAAHPEQVRFVSLLDAFRGHESPAGVCGAAEPESGEPWIRGNVGTGLTTRPDCFHPNTVGAAAISAAVLEVLER